MTRNERIVSYTSEELEAMARRGEDRTDWARVDALTEAELEAAIAADPDADITGAADDRSRVRIGIPRPTREVRLRLDADVVGWFQAQGPGYQSRINAVLRAYVDSRRHGDDKAAYGR